MENSREFGTTLIELMIGMTIGLIVLATIGSVYMSTRQTARTNEAAARMQESGRFALTLLTDHLAHAGYFGPTIFASTILGKATDPTPVTYTLNDTDCATNWVTDINVPLQVFNGTNPYSGTCIADVTSGTTRWNWIAETDVLELRNANPIRASSFQAGQLYIRGDLNSAAIFFGNTPPDPAQFSGTREDHGIAAYAYYVANYSIDSGETWQPALMRVASGPFGSNVRLWNQEVFPLVENMQIEVGEDTNNDGDADAWGPANAATNYNRVSALRIWLLIRAADRDISFNATNATITYTLGDTSLARNDNFRRTVFVKTIRLRNINQTQGT